jgi:hypothetical protein
MKRKKIVGLEMRSAHGFFIFFRKTRPSKTGFSLKRQDFASIFVASTNLFVALRGQSPVKRTASWCGRGQVAFRIV